MEHSSISNFSLSTARFNPNKGQLLLVKVVKRKRDRQGTEPVSKAFSVDGTLTGYTVFVEKNPEVYLNEGDVLEVEVREVHKSFSRARALRRIKNETETKTVLHRKEEPAAAPKLDG